MWQGIQAITDYKVTPLVGDSDALFPDTMKALFTELLLHIANTNHTLSTGQHISTGTLKVCTD